MSVITGAGSGRDMRLLPPARKAKGTFVVVASAVTVVSVASSGWVKIAEAADASDAGELSDTSNGMGEGGEICVCGGEKTGALVRENIEEGVVAPFLSV
jgi:hypothetical protein